MVWSDDIVVRLLDFAETHYNAASYRYVLRKEAADEIIKLRATIREMEAKTCCTPPQS